MLRPGDLILPRINEMVSSIPLDLAIDRMQTSGCSALLVEREGELVGLLTSEHLCNWLLLHFAWHERPVEQELQR
ncbi:MAG TPA: hypothetical protein VMM56_11795 [Planctomycetaceae bacterium]|nr:hypothetical protein [Planctomycetaceae bacterium]